MSYMFEPQQFVGAILNPARSFLIDDPELKEGNVQMVQNQNSSKRPSFKAGGTAIVYKFETKSRGLKALRLFFSDPKDEVKKRYAALTQFFSRADIKPFIANFIYHNEGILIANTVYRDGRNLVEQERLPVIIMDWIEHVPISDYVTALCDKQNVTKLKNLYEQWHELMNVMKGAQMAHGDLSHNNVIVDPAKGRIFLVDYDDVHLPGLLSATSAVVGTANFQHPTSNERPYGPNMDDFSFLLISTALLAAQAQPDVWIKHMKPGDERMLFDRKDLQNPNQSPVCRDLKTIADLEFQAAFHLLLKACKAPAKGPFDLGNLLIDRRWDELKRALLAGDEIKVATLWQAIKHLPDAKQYAAQATPMAERIYERQSIALSLAIHSGNTRWMRWAHDRLIDPSLNRLTAVEQAKLQQSLVAFS